MYPMNPGYHPQQQAYYVDHSGSMQYAQAGHAAPAAAPQPQQQAAGPILNVDDALGYLEEVKREFKDDDQVYNSFLEIMKNFKSHALTTPGVIGKVSELFRGHPSLIQKFNRFLPAGFHIDAARDYSAMPAVGPGEPMPPAAGPGASQPMPHAGIPPHTAQTVLPAPPTRRPVEAVRHDGKPPEFDHAIQYVTKIKQRFSKTNPQVYSEFLEILHHYQQSSTSAADQTHVINDVLTGVATLFQDHPDLLQDFRFFLPDTIQQAASERLQQIVAEQQYARRHGTHAAGAEAERAEIAGEHAQYAADYAPHHPGSRAHADERAYQAYMHQVSVGMGPARSQRGAAVAAAARDAAGMVHPQVSEAERAFFHRVKVALGGRETWVEFLKTLDLFSRGVLPRADLLALLEPVLPARLLDELKTIIVTKGAADISPADAYHTLPVADLDFKGCARCTPSYRSLPDGYPQLRCSERAPWEQSVLNDLWVSIQTGSEDYSFKHMRRNGYEEALFKCEDERYEVDMVVDTNASAIRLLEPLAQEIATLRAAKGYQWQFRLDRRALGVVHLKAIARVYGTRGEEMLELLRKNPGGAVPVILARLKQKDIEWRLARRKHNERWRKVMADNFHRSLDHRSFYFRQQDKRATAAKGLVQEMRRVIDAAQAEAAAWRERRSGAEPAAAAPAKDAKSSKPEPVKGSTGSVRYTASGLAVVEPTLLMRFEDTTVFTDASDLIARAVERYVHDKVRAASVWHSFCARFLRMPEARPGAALDDAVPSGEGIPAIGDSVRTRYGVGVAAAVRWGNQDVLKEDEGAAREAMRIRRSASGDASPSAPAASSSSSSSSASASPGPSGAGCPVPMVRVRLVNFAQAFVVLPAASVTVVASPELERVRLGISGGTAAGSLIAGGGIATGSSTLPAPGGRVRPLVPDLPPPAQGVEAPTAVTDVAVAKSARRGGRKPRKGGAVAPAPAVRLTDDDAADGEATVPAVRPPPGSVFIGTAGDFVFFRIHQMICERLALAKRLAARPTKTAAHVIDRAVAEAAAAASSSSSSSSSSAEAAPDAPASEDGPAVAAERYRNFLTALHDFVKGSMEERAYEDECRELLGSGAYAVFTLDRMAQYAARQLGVIASDETSAAARAVYERHLLDLDVAATRAAAGPAPPGPDALDALAEEATARYRLDAASLLKAHSEDFYLIQYTPDTPETAEMGRQRAEQARRRAAERLGVAAEDAAPPSPAPAGLAANGALGTDPAGSLPRHAAGPADASAPGGALSIRFVGAPDPDDDVPATRDNIPPYAARLLTHGTLMRGALPPAVLAHEEAEAAKAEAAAASASSSGVVLSRNVRAAAASSSSSSADAAAPAVVRDGAIAASVTEGEGLAAAPGSTEVVAAVRGARTAKRPRPEEGDEPTAGQQALGKWADGRIAELPPADGQE